MRYGGLEGSIKEKIPVFFKFTYILTFVGIKEKKVGYLKDG